MDYLKLENENATDEDPMKDIYFWDIQESGKSQSQLVILLLICVGMLIIAIFVLKKERSVETFNVNVQTEQGIKDELIIAVFIQNIRKLVGEYYVQNLLKDVTVYNYETTILEVEKLDGGLSQIKFGITLQVGAHNPIGYDEVTYTIDSSGNVQTVDYQHIKSNFRNKSSVVQYF